MELASVFADLSSLSSALAQPGISDALMEFLVKECSEENFKFIQDVEKLVVRRCSYKFV
jgi:hypothetical protein